MGVNRWMMPMAFRTFIIPKIMFGKDITVSSKTQKIDTDIF